MRCHSCWRPFCEMYCGQLRIDQTMGTGLVVAESQDATLSLPLGWLLLSDNNRQQQWTACDRSCFHKRSQRLDLEAQGLLFPSPSSIIMENFETYQTPLSRSDKLLRSTNMSHISSPADMQARRWPACSLRPYENAHLIPKTRTDASIDALPYLEETMAQPCHCRKGAGLTHF